MATHLCFLKNAVSCIIGILIPLLILDGYQGYGILSIIISSTLVILSIFVVFTISTQKPTVGEKFKVNSNKLSISTTPQLGSEIEPTPQEIKSQEEEEEEEVDRRKMDQLQEVDWPMQDNIFWSSNCLDGSISDEESLIEIALHQAEEVDDLELKEPSLYLQKKWPEIDIGAIFRQHGLVELLAELNDLNEEENLIEIDLSLGSIKYPRLEIEA